MRVSVDARPAIDPRRTGVGHVHAGSVAPSASRDGRGPVRGVVPRRPRRRSARSAVLGLVAQPDGARHQAPLPCLRSCCRAAARAAYEWLAGASDLLVATNFLPPPTRSRGVVLVVHDLAFDTMPETAPHHNERWRRAFAVWLRRAAAVIVPSEATRDDLFARHDVEHARVSVVPHGTDAEAFTPASPPWSTGYARGSTSQGPTSPSSAGSSLARTSSVWSRRSGSWPNATSVS